MSIIFTVFVIVVVIKALYLNEERKLARLVKIKSTPPSSIPPKAPESSPPSISSLFPESSARMAEVAENISVALGDMNIKFNHGMHDHETPVFRFDLPLAEMQSDVVVFMRPSYNVITVLVDNPVFIPKLKRRAIFEFIGMINYDFNLANFEMDHKDGSIRLRNILLMTEPESLSSEKINSWLRNSFEMMDLAFPGFMAISYGNAVPSEVWAKIKSRVDPSLN
jgi:hypothetical protein